MESLNEVLWNDMENLESVVYDDDDDCFCWELTNNCVDWCVCDFHCLDSCFSIL